MSGYPVRDCATALVRLFETHAGHQKALCDGIAVAVRGLREREDLASLGVKRQGNFVDNSRYLYFDGQLEITLNQMPNGKRFPVHDHGTPEALIIYKGRLRHTVYERIDAGDREGHAVLQISDERVLEPGDITLMMPPVDIHGFEALTDDTFVLTVLEGRYKPDRHFYQPEDQTYVVGRPPGQR